MKIEAKERAESVRNLAEHDVTRLDDQSGGSYFRIDEYLAVRRNIPVYLRNDIDHGVFSIIMKLCIAMLPPSLGVGKSCCVPPVAVEFRGTLGVNGIIQNNICTLNSSQPRALPL